MKPEQEYPSTGFEPIDADHARLSLVFGELLDAVHEAEIPLEQVQRLDAKLIEEVEGHFVREEGLMKAADYPLLERHRKAHQSFLADARKAREELLAEGLTPGFRKWVTGKIISWFRQHVVADDIGLAQFLLEVERAAVRATMVQAKGARRSR